MSKILDMAKTFEAATSRSKARTVSDQLKEAAAFIEMIQTGKGGEIVRWGIPGMDAVCKLQRGQIFTLAAPCGCGKTRFILNDLIGKIKLGVPSVLFSYENTSNIIYLGLKSILSGIPEDALTEPGGIRDRGNMERFKQAFDYLHDGKHLFRVFGKGDYKHTPGGIALELRRLKDAGFAPDMVYIDYLQNMTLGSRASSRTEELEKIVFELAELTSEFGAALVILSQLNRDKARAESKRRAGVCDLKGSSALEQVSDYIFFLNNADPGRRGVFNLDFYSVKARSSRGFANEELKFHSETGEILGVEPKHRYTKADRPDGRRAA